MFARGAPEEGPDGGAGTGGGQAGDLLDLLLTRFDLLDAPLAEAPREVAQPYVPLVPDVWTLAQTLVHLHA